MPTRFTLGVGKYAERLGMVAKGKAIRGTRHVWATVRVSVMHGRSIDDVSICGRNEIHRVHAAGIPETLLPKRAGEFCFLWRNARRV